MEKITGIYFSGTGNSRFAAQEFCKELDSTAKAYSIEDEKAIKEAEEADLIVIAYPVQYSTVPKILRDYIDSNKKIWNEKKVFVIATMGLFSGDGAGILGRQLEKHGATITGGLHLKMPDSIGDVKALKRPLEKNRELVRAAQSKIKEAARQLKQGTPTQEGIGPAYQIDGLFGQRLYFGHKTKKYSSGLKIDQDKCIGCSKCAKLCPMDNIEMENNKAVAKDRCTMCYRCINNCPEQAMTLLGKKVIEQSRIEKYV